MKKALTILTLMALGVSMVFGGVFMVEDYTEGGVYIFNPGEYKLATVTFELPQSSIIHIVTGRAGYSDFYKKDLTLNILGPVGDIVGEWIIKGAFLVNGDFGQFDWTADAVVDLSITVAMDYCILNY